MENTPNIRFHLPHEHGAWWTFFSCLLAGLIQALAWKADLGASFSLALGMACFFLASDWITAVAQSLFEGRGRRRSTAGSWAGWSLAIFGTLLLCFGMLRAEARHAGLGSSIAAGLIFWGMFIGVVLTLRLKLKARSLALMMPSALLLTAPAMLLGALAFAGLGRKAIEYWALWGWFFSFGVLYVHTWLRGSTLPLWRLTLASFFYLIEAAVLAAYSRWQGAVVLALLSLRVLWRIRMRMDSYRAMEAEFPGREMPRMLPTDPVEIRKLGWEQVGWSLVLSAIWIWRYWPGH